MKKNLFKKLSILAISSLATISFLAPQKIMANENNLKVYSSPQQEDSDHKIFVMPEELKREYVQLLRNLHANVNAERPDLKLEENVLWSKELELFANFYVDLQWRNFLSKGDFQPHIYITNEVYREEVYKRLKAIMPDYPYQVLLNNESIFSNSNQFAPLSKEDIYAIIVDYLTEQKSITPGAGHATALLGAKYIGASYNIFKNPGGGFGLHELNTYLGNTPERTYNSDPALEDYAMKNLYHNRNNVIRLLQEPKNTRIVHTNEGIKCLKNGTFVKSAWIVDNGSIYYFGENGIAYTGLKYMGAKEGENTPHWSYFGGDGKIRTGWQYINNHWSYFGKNGWMRTGWQYLDAKDNESIPHWSYFGKDGGLYTGWHNLEYGTENEHWSYFGNNGWLRTGWQYLDAKDGQSIPHFSYFGKNGWLRTGFVTFDKEETGEDTHTSYFGRNGWLRTGWQYLDSKDGVEDGFRYFGKNGWMRMGWQYLDAKDNEKTPHYSFFGNDGLLRTKLVLFEEKDTNEPTHYSYFGNNGHLVTNKKIKLNNTEYYADSRGWLTEIEKPRTLLTNIEKIKEY